MARRNDNRRRKSVLTRVLEGLMGLVVVGVVTIGTIAVFADNAALLAVLDIGAYLHVIGLGLGLGLTRLLVATSMRNKWVRTAAVVLTVAAVVMSAPVVPTMFRAVLIQQKPVASAPPQSTPLLVESRSLTHAAHRGQDLSHSRIVRSVVDDVDFGGARLRESDFRGSTFVNVNFAGTDLCAVDIRGANLERALHLDEVKNWRWVFFDAETRVPSTMSLERLAGPVESTTGELVYSCEPNQTRQITADGQRR
ncbi:pentapeptide repeat-containing protein [Micromonospora sp. KC723]|uniref:pentapeptide repeat-containing protein n=1 Tax=Micromonospora sp. KC723 TaxID=2530381 RepID=UPI001046F5A5|nr:pentapeptide repeat-containing protein [Micromonospora sp. KC723]TDB76141.1 pentapeptide repeat-containing protein [Micromonospora sp. KC723]